MRSLKVRVGVFVAAMCSVLFGLVSPMPNAGATLISTCGIACVSTVSGSASFPAAGTAGPFTMSFAGNAVSVRHLLGGDPSMTPITGAIDGHWMEPCSPVGDNIVRQLIMTVGMLVGPAVGPVLRALGVGSGCGTAIINGSAIGFTVLGNPSVGLALVGFTGIQSAFVLLLVGNPANYQGVFVNVNPGDIPNLPSEFPPLPA